jgi:putative oxidoreductase
MDGMLPTSWPWALFTVRVVLGIIFFGHGAQKVLGWYCGYGLAARPHPPPGPTDAGSFGSLLRSSLAESGLPLGFLTHRPRAFSTCHQVGAIAAVHAKGFFLNPGVSLSRWPGATHCQRLPPALAPFPAAGGGALSTTVLCG